MDSQVEIRKFKSMSPSHFLNLIQILDENDAWKFLMSIVPKVLKANSYEYEDIDPEYQDRKYNSKHIKLIENACKKDPRTPAEIFLFEWSHSGRQRPTLGHLFSLLKQAQLYRAADFLAVNILNQRAPERPASGPAAKINTLELDEELSDDEEANVNQPPSNITIANNLDNSKVQNTICGADVPKLIVPLPNTGQSQASTVLMENSNNAATNESNYIPIIQVIPPSSSGSHSESVNSLNSPEVSTGEINANLPIVLQSPQYSEEINETPISIASLNAPDISGILAGSPASPDIDFSNNLSEDSSELSKSSVSSNIPQLSSLLDNVALSNSSCGLPMFSDLLKSSSDKSG